MRNKLLNFSFNIAVYYAYTQAEPLFKDKKKFVQMADPLLQGNYPMKGLYQALAIAAMCLQEEANSRPLISDVVTALEYLADPNHGNLEESEESIHQTFSLPKHIECENDGANADGKLQFILNDEGELVSSNK